MRPAEISNNDIIQGGTSLRELGKNVTSYAIRRMVGGGNVARIKQVWEGHVAAEAAAACDPLAEVPHEVAIEADAVKKLLADQISLLVAGLNDRAVKAAQQRVVEIAKDAADQRDQLERELADAAQTIDYVESKLTIAEQEVDMKTISLAESQEHMQTLVVEIAQLNERLTAAETAGAGAVEERKKAEAWRVEAANLSGRLEEAQAVNEKLISSRAQ